MIVLTSLPLAGCSMLLRLQQGKLGCGSYEAMLVVQTVLRSRMNEVAVSREFEQQAVESQLSRPALVNTAADTFWSVAAGTQCSYGWHGRSELELDFAVAINDARNQFCRQPRSCCFQRHLTDEGRTDGHRRLWRQQPRCKLFYFSLIIIRGLVFLLLRHTLHGHFRKMF